MVRETLHNWGDHPVLVSIGALAGIATILAAIYTIRINDKKEPLPVVVLGPQIEAVNEILDALEIPAMLYSADLKLVYANDKMASMYKMKKSDMVGQSPDTLNLLIKPHVENYKDFAAEQLDRIARGHKGETEGRAQVPMRLSAEYLHRKSATSWYFVSNPVYISKQRFTLTQLLEQVEGPTESNVPCAPLR
jgi:hypothetical protein